MTFGWREWTRGQWLLRVVVLSARCRSRGTLAERPAAGLADAATLSSRPAGGGAESVVGGFALALVAFSWWPGGRDLPSRAVLAAVAMLAAHLAALVASYGRTRYRCRRTSSACGCGAASVSRWSPSCGWRRWPWEVPGSGTVWLLGLAVALSVTVVAAAATRSHSVGGLVSGIDWEEYTERVLQCVEQVPPGRATT